MSNVEEIMELLKPTHVKADGVGSELALKVAAGAVKILAEVYGCSFADALEMLEEATACQGHESLDGAHMGETVYCDGTCR